MNQGKGGEEINLKLFSVILIILMVMTGCATTRTDLSDPGNSTVLTIPTETVGDALDIALKKRGSPYVWGGDGPDQFDCSGLIVYTYKRATGKDIIFRIGDMPSRDIAMNDLYNWNVKLLTLDKITAGDIVFFTREEGKITHGGLFINWIDYKKKFLFINASSSHGGVVVDTWQIEDQNENYWFVGAGRLKRFF